MPSKLLPTKEQLTRIGSEVLLETFLNIWINEPSNHLEDLSPCQEDNAIHVNWSLCRTASDDPSTLPQFKFKLKSESLSETAISVSLQMGPLLPKHHIHTLKLSYITLNSVNIPETERPKDLKMRSCKSAVMSNRLCIQNTLYTDSEFLKGVRYKDATH